MYDKLVANVDTIDTSDFVFKTKYNTDKTKLENKIPDTSGARNFIILKLLN